MPDPKVIKVCKYIVAIGGAGSILTAVLVIVFSAFAQPKIAEIANKVDCAKWEGQRRYIDSGDAEVVVFVEDAFARLMFYQQENMTEGEILAAEAKYKRFQIDKRYKKHQPKE
jgi:hypothetical protein